jgi:hypothetical protein
MVCGVTGVPLSRMAQFEDINSIQRLFIGQRENFLLLLRLYFSGCPRPEFVGK